MANLSRIRALKQAQTNAVQQQQQHQQQQPQSSQSQSGPSHNAYTQPQNPAASQLGPSPATVAAPYANHTPIPSSNASNANYNSSTYSSPAPAIAPPQIQSALTGGWMVGYYTPANSWDPMEVDNCDPTEFQLDQAAWHYQNVTFPAMLISALVHGTPLQEPPASAWRRAGVEWEASAFFCVVMAQYQRIAQAEAQAQWEAQQHQHQHQQLSQQSQPFAPPPPPPSQSLPAQLKLPAYGSTAPMVRQPKPMLDYASQANVTRFR